MRLFESAWAVRIRVADSTAWLNVGGGYSRMRYDRRLWSSRSDAEEAMYEWRRSSPTIVRVVFKTRAQRQSKSQGGP